MGPNPNTPAGLPPTGPQIQPLSQRSGSIFNFPLDWIGKRFYVALMSNTNFSPVLDSVKRAELKVELLNLLKQRHRVIERGIQLEGVSLDNPTPETLTLVLVIQDIIREHREYSVIQWPGGISIVRTAGIDNLNKDFQQVNENSNYIVRGGTEEAADLLNNPAVPDVGEGN